VPDDTEQPPPGVARCPGPSMRDIICADSTGAADVLLTESYEFLGDADLALSRYTSSEFARAEDEHMWGRVWQWACRVEHLSEVGSFHVYDVGDRSALIVRDNAGVIRAFHNSCLHRGTQFKTPASCGQANRITCPYHGWSWTLEGRLATVPCRWDFPHVVDDQFTLPEIATDTWGGFVFINFDPDAPPLHEYLGVLPQHFVNWDLADRHVELHIRKRLPTNWKAATEAFLEAYHVLRTHSQALRTTGDANAQYDVFGDNVSRFMHTSASPSPHVVSPPDQQQIVDLLFARRFPDAAERPTVPDGQTARDVYAGYIQQNLGEKYGRDFSHLTVSETIDTIEYFLFPNACFFPGLHKPMVYRFRPDGDSPDQCIFDLVFLRPNPADGPPPPPAAPIDIDVDDSYASVPGMDATLGFVYDQDTGNMAAQTRGFKASTKRTQTLGNYQEVRIRHLHTTLDRYLTSPTQG
jgi:phenylpropionate dioxygenase-like ring-hydroxylating dioxygenase large terminal subunit